MLIHCPYCGARDAHEFTTIGGDAGPRPDPDAPDAEERFHDYVYLRDNKAGEQDEWWYHGAGCRAWLKVRRNTLTHEVVSVALANPEETP